MNIESELANVAVDMRHAKRFAARAASLADAVFWTVHLRNVKFGQGRAEYLPSSFKSLVYGSEWFEAVIEREADGRRWTSRPSRRTRWGTWVRHPYWMGRMYVGTWLRVPRRLPRRKEERLDGGLVLVPHELFDEFLRQGWNVYLRNPRSQRCDVCGRTMTMYPGQVGQYHAVRLDCSAHGSRLMTIPFSDEEPLYMGPQSGREPRYHDRLDRP